MNSPAVTVDAFDLSVHQRYARDQAFLDTTYIHEPPLVAAHPEITSTSSLYASKWEELFETYKRSSPWALFEPPKNYAFQSKRFFSFCLLPTISYNPFTEDSSNPLEPSPPSIYGKRPLPFASKEKVLKEIVNAASTDPEQIESAHLLSSLIATITEIDKMLAIIAGSKAKQKG